MTHNEIIAIVQAHKDGKQIQSRSHFAGTWEDCNPVWDFYQNDYRVAPEPRKPREWAVHVLKGGFTEQGAITSFPAHEDSIKETIRVREVIENEV